MATVTTYPNCPCCPSTPVVPTVPITCGGFVCNIPQVLTATVTSVSDCVCMTGVFTLNWDGAVSWFADFPSVCVEGAKTYEWSFTCAAGNIVLSSRDVTDLIGCGSTAILDTLTCTPFSIVKNTFGFILGNCCIAGSTVKVVITA